MSNRKSKQDWIAAGVDCLKTLGPPAISAEKLSKFLGVTRGSFYHHFANISEFNKAVLDYWVESSTTSRFQIAKENSSNPKEELAQLVELSWQGDIDLEIAVRTWAASNEQAQQCIADIDKFRLDYLITLYSAVMKNEEKGKRLAQIAFYGLLGAIHAQPRIAQQELGELVRAIQNMLLKEL